MDTFTYFAYGSNMLAERLQKRCPSANFVGIAHIEGYALVFNKKSIDGSGKATITRATVDDSILYGVLYEISSFEGHDLDRFEGRGYKKYNQFMVTKMGDGNELVTTTYIAAPSSIDEDLVSYDWYKELVLSGAKQAKLPTRTSLE